MWQCGKVASRGFRSRDEQPIQDDSVWVSGSGWGLGVRNRCLMSESGSVKLAPNRSPDSAPDTRAPVPCPDGLTKIREPLPSAWRCNRHFP